MDFNKAITWTGKIFHLLKKVGLENVLSLDKIIDSNFPEVLSRLQTYSSKGKIAVVSTNGKKTTADLICQILFADNQTSISNIDSNAKKYPILTSIILNLANSEDFSEDYKKDYYVMALDEIEAVKYFNSIKFDYMLLNNIFEDQKSFLTLEEKKRTIQDAISLNTNCNLVINADEPMFFNIGEIKNDITNKKLNKFYFGFNKIEAPDNNTLIQENDIARCPVCGCKLDYDKRFYSHIGIYNCECGFKRPKLDISADAKIFNDYSFLTVYFEDNKFVFKLPFGGVYNVYNALGAIALAFNLGVKRKVITSAFENYVPISARDEFVKYKGRNVKIKLIKNPVSLSEATRELLFQKKAKLVFCLNDDEQDGIDTSWVWNSNLMSLTGFENKIYVCGTRCDDMALKIKYSGVNPNLIISDNSISNCIKCCCYDLEKEESMIIFSCPSAIAEIQNLLEK